MKSVVLVEVVIFVDVVGCFDGVFGSISHRRPVYPLKQVQ